MRAGIEQAVSKSENSQWVNINHKKGAEKQAKI